MRRKPKNAPWPVLMILLPFVAVMTLWDLADCLVSIVWEGLQRLGPGFQMALDVIAALIDIVWDGLQRLGPRFQGFVLGVWAGFFLVMVAVSLAVFG